MLDFISEDICAKHRYAYSAESLRLSVLLRASGISGKSPREIAAMRIKGVDTAAISEIAASVLLHECFFSSFAYGKNQPSRIAKRDFGSEASLISELYRLAVPLRLGFVAVLASRDKAIARGAENCRELLSLGEPILALDLSEHAYFCDFGFDKGAYLAAALPRLALSRLDAYFLK